VKSWHIRTPDGYIGAVGTLQLAVASCRRLALDLRRNATLEHIGAGAYVYHGPRRGKRGELFTAYLYDERGCKVFGYDVKPALPLEELVSR
jgi:hypothetical protein